MSIWTHTKLGAWAKVAVLPLAAAGLLLMAGCEDVEEPGEPVTPEVPSIPEPEVSSTDDTTASLVSLRMVEEGEQLKPYPLDVCIVSNEPLDAMGGPAVRAWGDQEVKFCCSGCLEDFEAKPAEHLAKMAASAATGAGAEAAESVDHAH